MSDAAGKDTSDITNEDLWDSIDSVLTRFPHFRGQLPGDYPRGKKFGITLSQMQSYAETMASSQSVTRDNQSMEAVDRRRRWWHQLNLPMVLHNALPSIEPAARELMESLLKTLNKFAEEFAKVPGVSGTLAPLWGKDAWHSPPRFWSVMASVFLALNYRNAGYEVEGLELKLGEGDLDADITLRVNGIRTNVDVEMWHAARFDGCTTEQARSMLIKRANEKSGTKFVDLPADEYGIAHLVCVARGEDFDRFRNEPRLTGLLELEGRERRFGFVSWLGGVRVDGGPLQWAIFTKPLPTTSSPK